MTQFPPQRRFRRPPIGAVIALACATLAGAAGRVEVAPAWRDKVHPLVLEEVAHGPSEFILVLRDQADVGPAGRVQGKVERTRAVADLLREHARRTQAPLIHALEGLGVEFRSFWVANMVWVRGDAATLERLARRGDVLRVDANPRVRMQPSDPEERSVTTRSTTGVEWNVSQIRVDTVWQMGFVGTGVVVGGQDTGYQWDHPALIAHYRGWNGTEANHDHNWHDAIHTTGSYCGADSTQPCDDDSHGTHTMGIMIGDDGGANRIGVAPGARWIGCRNMDRGIGTPTTYAECFQWMIAPTDLAGQNPDPSLAPDVISNSWICPPSEGCSQGTLRTIVENTRAAGIVVVASAGNDGPFCTSLNDPPAIYDASFTVGSTDSLDVIATSSSRGPVTVDGSGRRKPDVSAPGVAVRSSVPFDSYHVFSGTSMAGPHVAGLVALLLDARPDLAGRVDDIEAILAASTVPLTTLDGCGGDTASSVPNNTYGWGRVDAVFLIDGDADVDGVTNLDDCAPVDPEQWSDPGPARSVLIGADRSTLQWSPPADPGGTGVVYDVVRSAAADDFGSATCVAAGLSTESASDPDVPTQSFYYLVRTRNGCGASLGQGTTLPRSAPSCS